MPRLLFDLYICSLSLFLKIVLVLSFFIQYMTCGLLFCYLMQDYSYMFTLIPLQERENLSSLERKYSELTGGQAFPLNPVSMKEVLQTNSTSKEETKLRNDKKVFSILKDYFIFLFEYSSTFALWRRGGGVIGVKRVEFC